MKRRGEENPLARLEDLDERENTREEEIESNNRARELDIVCVLGIMETELGRRAVYRWISKTGVYENQFAANGHNNAFLSGMRAAGMNIIKDLEITSPDLYLRMLKENHYEW